MNLFYLLPIGCYPNLLPFDDAKVRRFWKCWCISLPFSFKNGLILDENQVFVCEHNCYSVVPTTFSTKLVNSTNWAIVNCSGRNVAKGD